MKLERNSAGIVIYRLIEGVPEILLLTTACGRYSPPKGGREGCETELENAIRETYEESGLTVEDFDFIQSYRHEILYKTSRYKTKQVVLFLAKIKHPDTTITVSSEHIYHTWMKFEDAVVSRNHAASNESFAKMYRNVFGFIKQIENLNV